MSGLLRAKATIASNILITVTDSGIVEVKPSIALFDVLAKIKIRFFGKTFKFFDSFDPVPVNLIVYNKGKNLIKPEGTINLRGGFGLNSKYDIIPKNILAGSQRLLEATPSALFDDKLPSTLTLTGFFIGSYKLSTDISFGENSPQIFASTSFISFPFKLFIGIIVAILGTIFIIKRFSSED